MPRPQDHVVEQERSTEAARPREADQLRESRVQPTDLQARLERLPVGHPSSPYRDDGSRKPPPPDLARYELPLPDELPPDTEQPDPDLSPEDKARVSSDGSWDWKGSHLAPEQSRAADQGLAKCRDAEGRDSNGNYGDYGLTSAMRRIEAQLEHGHLIKDTEKFALKDPDRFKEKLADMIKDEPDKPVEQLVDDIHDGIRYTFIFAQGEYVSALKRTANALEQHGFELGVRKNTWGKDEYRAVNTRWRDGDSGQRFEVQFHTEESWQAKQDTHEAYVRINDIRTPTAERERLRAYQYEVSARVMPPASWEEITDYRKEGW
jgi:hypothetical protein